MNDPDRMPDDARPAVLAVDGGASKTDAVLVGLDGELLGHRRGPGTNHQTVGWPTALQRLAELRAGVLSDARVTLRATHVYLAGLDLPEEIEQARAALAEWDADIVDNDVFALLRSGTRAPDAAAVICGTGMNAVGIRADGTTARFLAFGEMTGDWGGGQMLGRDAVGLAMRSLDGRGRASALTERIPAAVGVASVTDLVLDVYHGRADAEVFSRVTPVVFAVAAEGDEVAQQLVERQAEEIALMATSVIDRLGMRGQRVPVVLGGGVIAGGSDLLMAAVEEALRVRSPHAVAVVPAGRPILGAALAALEGAGAAHSALERLTLAGSAPGWP